MDYVHEQYDYMLGHALCYCCGHMKYGNKNMDYWSIKIVKHILNFESKLLKNYYIPFSKYPLVNID